jgi:hypothetical protein
MEAQKEKHNAKTPRHTTRALEENSPNVTLFMFQTTFSATLQVILNAAYLPIPSAITVH